MGYYLQTNSDQVDMLASNSGWSDTTAFIETLDKKSYPELHHLVESGWSDDCETLAAELTSTAEEATDLVKEILAGFSKLLDPKAIVVSVTDGLGSEPSVMDSLTQTADQLVSTYDTLNDNSNSLGKLHNKLDSAGSKLDKIKDRLK